MPATRVERDLYYHEFGGGTSATYRLWTPEADAQQFPTVHDVCLPDAMELNLHGPCWLRGAGLT